MVVDASAILAILKAEPDGLDYAKALSRPGAKQMSPVNWYECAVRLGTNGDFDVFDSFVREAEIEIVPVDAEIMRFAHRAWARFGKGRNPAKLNLGDCFAYALAKKLNEPLLYKGADFSRTDLTSAL